MQKHDDQQRDKAIHIERVLEETIRRRALGEHVADDDLVDAYPRLAPQLGARLKQLALIEQARARATSVHTPAHTLPVLNLAQHPDIPGYTITGELHRGGQAVVYDAVQSSTGQRVVIKLLYRPSTQPELERRRYERESEILAQLEDPRFVRLLDRGTCNGRPFLVLERAGGFPVDEYAARHKASLRDTLELFARICDSVHTAHLIGVIHRDLKPQHVLIDEHENIRILDFGLARWARPAQRDETTVAGDFVGSMLWASPEQARGDREIDLRSDVYSLGVILYRLVSGKFPYEVAGGAYNTLDNIIHAPPKRLPRAGHAVDHDLETVLLTCLAKDRERRYQTAGDLAEDLRCVLRHRPIRAKRDKPLYVARKFARRHVVLTVFTTMFTLTLLGGSAGMTFLYLDARASQRRAQRAQQEAEHAADITSDVTAFLLDVFQSANPNQEMSRGTTVEEVLKRAADRLNADSVADPATRIHMLAVLADVYESLGWFREAIPLRDEVCTLTAADSQLSGARGGGLGKLAHTYLLAGDLARAEETAIFAQEVLSSDDGDENAQVGVDLTLGRVNELGGRYEAAASYYECALRMARERFEGDPRRLGEALQNVALFEIARNDYAKAAALVREGLAKLLHVVAPDHPQALDLQITLAFALHRLGQNDEAEDNVREVWRRRVALYGQGHPASVEALNLLCIILDARGKHDEADEHRVVLLTAARSAFGPDHPDTAVILINVGEKYLQRGEYERANALYQDALRIVEAHQPNHSRRAVCLTKLGLIAEQLGDLRGAEAYHRQALAVRESLEEAGATWGSAWQQAELAGFLARHGNKCEAEALVRSALEQLEASNPEDYQAALRGARRHAVNRLRTAAEALALRNQNDEDVRELLRRAKSLRE